MDVVKQMLFLIRLFAPIRESEADFAVVDKSFSAENISHMGSIPR